MKDCGGEVSAEQWRPLGFQRGAEFILGHNVQLVRLFACICRLSVLLYFLLYFVHFYCRLEAAHNDKGANATIFKL